ncbi:MAG: JAB domain-containing protein [Bacteroidetes bacterium]|nr:JAB domain-containing protein [Bacteroidota bacterium]MCA6442540.1 JAB domain-containing protein [Bacteroidota bacterium]
MQVKLTETEKIRILNSEDIYSVMQRILLRENKIERNKEHFWIIGLAQNSRILYIELISVGTINKTIVEPMEVFSIALQKRTVKVILVHNHPSGNVRPSEEDKDITDRLIQVGNIINIEVLDHLIITDKSYNSFSDTGIMNELERSTKYLPPYKLQERIKKEAEKIGEDRGEKRKALKIAQELKNKTFPNHLIVQLTGITEAEAKKLKAQKDKSTKK